MDVIRTYGPSYYCDIKPVTWISTQAISKYDTGLDLSRGVNSFLLTICLLSLLHTFWSLPRSQGNPWTSLGSGSLSNNRATL